MSGKEDWVDYKEIKNRVTMEMVLDRYGVNWLKKKKGYLVGHCPIHQGNNETAFNVSTSKNNWHCFTGCKSSGRKSGGNVIDFVVAMEKLPETAEGFRDAALKLKQWFMIDSVKNDAPGSPIKRDKTPDRVETLPPSNPPEQPKSEPKKETKLNTPLTFSLKNLDPDHEYLKGRGIDRELADYFGIGFYKGKTGKEMMAGRMAIPIHNGKGELVAYAGRAVTPEQEAQCKYKLPAGFLKTLELYNLHRAAGYGKDRGLILVEGFFDVVRLHQLGFLNVVALMGSSMSLEQELLLLGATDRVMLMFDGDPAGRECTHQVALALVGKMFVRIVRLPDGKQPDSLTKEEVSILL